MARLTKPYARHPMTDLINASTMAGPMASVSSQTRPQPVADNPKKAFGDIKPGLHYVPLNVMLDVAAVMKLGADKYGLKNWREQPIRSSTYYDAMLRHIIAWFEGRENSDPESGKSHLAHAICCAMLVMDSAEKGILIDDRGETEVLTKGVGE